MSHIIGHNRYARETYPTKGVAGGPGPQGPQETSGLRGPKGMSVLRALKE